MDQHSYVLAVLATAAGESPLSPVQVQKLFFIIDEEVPGLVGGPYFDFQPYDFGPFDKDVYGCLDVLENLGLVMKSSGGPSRVYRLTAGGYDAGARVANDFSEEVSGFIREIGAWVRSLTFSQLVSAVYRQYPEMKANSIFRQ